MAEPQRLGWMDGLRGLAALQVVLLHAGSAFLPGFALARADLARSAWEMPASASPLFFLIDGYAAVYIFFLLSGAALSYSFASDPFAVHFAAARRVVRLGLPMAAAIALGAALLAVGAGGNLRVVELVGMRGWLPEAAGSPATWGAVLHQIAFEGLLTGYRGYSLWPGFVTDAAGAVPAAGGINPALWTLHVEMAGSLGVMALVALRAGARRAVHDWVCGVLCLGLLMSPMLPFVIGHLVAPWLARRGDAGRPAGRRPGLQTALGVALLGLGVLACANDGWAAVAALRRAWPGLPFGMQMSLLETQSMLGAVLVFFGVALLPRVQAMLATPGPAWLGRVSFGLYLVHLPILLTAASWLFVAAWGGMGPGPALWLTLPVYLAVCLAVASLFTRWVDVPAIRLSRHFKRRTLGRAAAVPGLVPPG